MAVSIRARLLLLMLAVLLPAVAASGWLIEQTYDAERLAHERALRDTARALSMVVDRELSQRATVARLLAQSSNLDQAPDLTPEQLGLFEQQVQRAMRGMKGWVELASADRVLMDSRRAAGARARVDRKEARGTDAAAAPARELVDLPSIAPLQLRSPPADSYAAIVQPVQRGGRTLLNLTVTIRPAELQRIIDEQHLPGDWYGSVLDSRATIVARQPGGSAYTGRSATPDLRERLAMQAEGFFESTSLDDGIATAGYYSTSPQGWTYIIAMPLEQYAGRLPAAVFQVGAGAVLLLGLATVAALWVAHGIVRPVVALKLTAARMQAGLAVRRDATGILECDEVVGALADAAQAMQDARSNLERQVEQAVRRTREAEQRASYSQHVEALGRLTGGVAHDFNNLLGVISNSAHLMLRHAHAPELQAPLAATLRAVEVGSRLTQSMLRMAGRQPVRPQSLDLGRHLPDLQELLQTVLGKRIAIEVAVAPQTRPVTVDPGEFELALINLALNARDAMPAGGQVWLRAANVQAEAGPTLAADTSGGQSGGPWVNVSFTDEGRGLDAASAECAFEPFFTTKEVGKGTGLGLAQVRGFCVQAGGVATLASTPGLGTTVSLLLPASDMAVGSDPVTAARDSLVDTGIRGASLLLVEDNDELATATATLLETYGCLVRRARDSEAALKIVETDPDFDAVLSDIVMPGALDGIALARTLRHQRPDLPVLLITGYSTAAASVHDFVVLRKPCPREELVRALRDAIGTAQADRK